jgi:tetratricopeptide (TPR) repeat protein
MDDVYGRYAEALRAGHQFAASGQLKEALKCYRAATEFAPDRPVPHVALGGAQLRLGQNKDALASYERALELAPHDVDALTGRAAALLGVGKRDEAKEVQQHMYGGFMTPSGVLGHGGVPVSAADRHLASGENARQAGKTNAAIDEWLAESTQHRLAGHHDAALDACLRALSLDSSAQRVHLEIARAWMARGWHDRAHERLRLLDRLLALQPDKHVAAAAKELSRR